MDRVFTPLQTIEASSIDYVLDVYHVFARSARDQVLLIQPFPIPVSLACQRGSMSAEVYLIKSLAQPSQALLLLGACVEAAGLGFTQDKADLISDFLS